MRTCLRKVHADRIGFELFGAPARGRVNGTDAQRRLAELIVDRFGGRYSSELGIDVDAGEGDVERWFIAATLFGARISAKVAARTFDQLVRAGINRIVDVAGFDRDSVVALLDAGGYARFDFRTATRLSALGEVVGSRYGGEVAEIGRRFTDPETLVLALDDLPGWGPVTVGLFLRELRGVWRGVPSALDSRAAQAARHIGPLTGRPGAELAELTSVAQQAGYDERDVESALVRLALAHRKMTECPGKSQCVSLAVAPPASADCRSGTRVLDTSAPPVADPTAKPGR